MQNRSSSGEDGSSSDSPRIPNGTVVDPTRKRISSPKRKAEIRRKPLPYPPAYPTPYHPREDLQPPPQPPPQPPSSQILFYQVHDLQVTHPEPEPRKKIKQTNEYSNLNHFEDGYTRTSDENNMNDIVLHVAEDDAGDMAGSAGVSGLVGTSSASVKDKRMSIDQIILCKPHPCHLCPGAFKRLSDLKRHVATVHEDRRNFKCIFCTCAFQQKSHLESHILAIHKKEKPYVCDLCGGSFVTKSNVIKHKRCVHEGQRPFRCALCSAAFAQRIDLKRHQKNMHGKEDDDD